MEEDILQAEVSKKRKQNNKAMKNHDYQNLFIKSFFEDLFLKKVNGVSDTETFIDFGLWYMDESEFIDIITQRTKGNQKQYFLFDFLKIWQREIK